MQKVITELGNVSESVEAVKIKGALMVFNEKNFRRKADVITKAVKIRKGKGMHAE